MRPPYPAIRGSAERRRFGHVILLVKQMGIFPAQLSMYCVAAHHRLRYAIIHFHRACLTFYLLTAFLQEIGQPVQRLVRLVDGQVLHTFQEVWRNVRVQELTCWSAMCYGLIWPSRWLWWHRAWSVGSSRWRSCDCRSDRRKMFWNCGRSCSGKRSWSWSGWSGNRRLRGWVWISRISLLNVVERCL